MAVDTPARIAILGAGPIGLEAALYARFLGYDVDVYERGLPCESWRQWDHVRLFSPWRDNVSSLGVAALEAQDPYWRPLDDDANPTGREMVAAYFQPLADSDLLSDGLHVGTEVLGVSRWESLKGDLPGQSARGDADAFAILLRDKKGERLAQADIVFDCTGAAVPNGLGIGGLPALGEFVVEDRIARRLPDALGADRERYAGRRVLVVGAGHAAASAVISLAELAKQGAGTQVTWAARRVHDANGPVRRIPDDPLMERDKLAIEANELAAGANRAVQFFGGVWVREIASSKGALSVHLHDVHTEEESPATSRPPIEVDAIVAAVGGRPDHSLTRELQVHRTPWSDAPRDPRCETSPLQPTPESLVQPEIDFYVLGAKTFGRDHRFSLTIGREQIRAVFSIIGDRADLNLYARKPSLG